MSHNLVVVGHACGGLDTSEAIRQLSILAVSGPIVVSWHLRLGMTASCAPGQRQRVGINRQASTAAIWGTGHRKHIC